MTEIRTYIGKGRSAKVYKSTKNGRELATKVFVGEGLSKCVLFVLTGSANPYTWNQDAIHCAMLRRSLLSKLCRYWFGDDLQLPETFEQRWNAEEKAYELEMEYIDGSHVPLINPVDDFIEDAASRQMTEVMLPLQARLIESGFDGMVWQAGKGNPVALSNFMCRLHDGKVSSWIWIDMESGVPALFALNPLATLFYYLPKCWRHRGALFDDVDTQKLESYLAEHKVRIVEALDAEAYELLTLELSQLTEHQQAWKGIPRFRRSLLYAHSQGKVSDEQKEYYYSRQIAWYIHSLFSLLASLFRKICEHVLKYIKYALHLPFMLWLRMAWSYMTSSEYRWRFISLYLRHQLNKWHSRKCLSDQAKVLLNHELNENRSSACLTDFSMHLALKPLIEFTTWFVVPLMLTAQSISIVDATYLALFLGPAVRTAYTLLRFLKSFLQRRPYYPVVALVVGALPAIGNLAYPLELLARSSRNDNKLEKFIVYALLAKIGKKIPIWGGQDSGVEHFFNRCCHRIFGGKGAPKSRATG